MEKMLGLRTVAYFVSDLQKAKEWYAKAFDVEPYFNEPYYVGFNVGGYELGLQPEEKHVAVKTDNVLTYWGVENINKAFKQFLDLGASVHEKPKNVGEELMVASVMDPWGNVIGIIYNPYFKLDQ